LDVLFLQLGASGKIWGLRLEHLVTKNMVSKFHKFTFWCQGFLKMIKPIFSWKYFLAFSKKNVTTFKKKHIQLPPLLHLWRRQRHTHTHIISNEVKYINYYNCSKWIEVPQIDHGQSQQGMCNHTLLDLALFLSYCAQEHQSKTHSVESPEHFRQKYVFMRNYSFNANDLTWDKICLCMSDFQNVAQTRQED
jgi:hypothetical protein